MSNFAQVDDKDVVTRVLVIEQDVIDSGQFGDPKSFIQASYNTRAGVHYGPDGKPDGKSALRGNYPGPGWTYDRANDVFVAPPRPDGDVS